MKTILMALVLISSVSAQARVLISLQGSEPQLKSIEEVAIAPNGNVFVRSGPSDSVEIPQVAVKYTGLSTKEFVDYIREFNTDTKKHLTLSLRGPTQLISQVSLTFSK